MGIQLIAYLSGRHEIEEICRNTYRLPAIYRLAKHERKGLILNFVYRGQTCVRELCLARFVSDNSGSPMLSLFPSSREQMHSLFLQPWSESSSDN